MQIKNERLVEKIKRELGSQVCAALNDPSVIEVSLNPDGKLFIERFGEGMREVASIDAAMAEAAIKTIASYHDFVVTKKAPSLSCELPIDGSRFEALIPPVVSNPTFSIRKKASKVFTLEEYVSSGILSKSQCERLVEAIKTHQNIVVVGGTGSGKTTLTNAIIAEISNQFPQERLVIIEDTNEIQSVAKNVVIAHSTPTTPMLTLLKSTMRLRPDRILVGEVRGGEAWTLLKAWNTGHPGGVVTIHADSAVGALSRLEQCSAEEPTAPPPMYLKAVIAEAVNLIVHITKTKDSRIIKEMLEVNGHSKDQYLTQTTGEQHHEQNTKPNIKPVPADRGIACNGHNSAS